MEIELDFTKCPFCGLPISTEAELTRNDEWRRGATELFNRWLYLEEKGLLSCAKTLARETKVFLKTLGKKP